MVRKKDADVAEAEAALEEAEKPKVGRPRRETTGEKAFRTIMVQQAKAQTRTLKALKGMFSQFGGGRSYGKHCQFGRYFLPMMGLPGSDALEAEVNRLLGEWTSGGWYPVHVTSQSGILETQQGGQLKGEVITILWGHD